MGWRGGGREVGWVELAIIGIHVLVFGYSTHVSSYNDTYNFLSDLAAHSLGHWEDGGNSGNTHSKRSSWFLSRLRLANLEMGCCKYGVNTHTPSLPPPSKSGVGCWEEGKSIHTLPPSLPPPPPPPPSTLPSSLMALILALISFLAPQAACLMALSEATTCCRGMAASLLCLLLRVEKCCTLTSSQHTQTAAHVVVHMYMDMCITVWGFWGSQLVACTHSAQHSLDTQQVTCRATNSTATHVHVHTVQEAAGSAGSSQLTALSTLL